MLRPMPRGLAARVTVACVLALLSFACSRGERVRFLQACTVYSEPTRGAGQVGKVIAGREYEVRRRRGNWVQVQVTSNSSIGWTDCPTQP